MICVLRQHHHPPTPTTHCPTPQSTSTSIAKHLASVTINFPTTKSSSPPAIRACRSPPFTRPPSHHWVCSPGPLPLPRTQTTVLPLPGVHNTRELVWALQCPHQPVGPPAQHSQQSPPHPPPPFPPPDEIAVLVAASAIRNPAHHNRAPAKK
jgi:hypothetical protein